MRRYADFLRKSGNAPAARHFFDRKSAPTLPARYRTCLNMRGFVTEKWKLARLSAFLIENQRRFSLRELGFVWKYGDLWRKCGNRPTARHLFDQKSAPTIPPGYRICLRVSDFFTEKWEHPRRSAVVRSKSSTNLSCGASDLSEHARIRREKVRTAPLLGICLVENQGRFILRGRGCVWKYADFSRKSGNVPTARHLSDQKSVPTIPARCWICLNMRGSVTASGNSHTARHFLNRKSAPIHPVRC